MFWKKYEERYMCLKTPARHVRSGSSSQGTAERVLLFGLGWDQYLCSYYSLRPWVSELKQYMKGVTGSCASLQLPVRPLWGFIYLSVKKAILNEIMLQLKAHTVDNKKWIDIIEAFSSWSSLTYIIIVYNIFFSERFLPCLLTTKRLV